MTYRYTALVTTIMSIIVITPAMAFAQGGVMPQQEMHEFSPTKVFTFLFVTLGPFKVFRPFSLLTVGHDVAFKRKLAFQGFIISSIAALLAATLGPRTLEMWDISAGSLHLTAGIVLFLIALQSLLSQYAPQHPQEPASPDVPVSKLAFSPLAFPTIVTPYGIAVIILLIALHPEGLWQILGLTIIVFVLDLLAMLGADQIERKSSVISLIGIIGAVMGVLQVALGVQAVINALHMLGLVHA